MMARAYGSVVTLAAVLGSAIVLSDCAPLRQRDDGMAHTDNQQTGQEIHATGEVAVVGSIPTEVVVLRTADGRQVQLEGERIGELRQLAGVEVAVTGGGTAERIRVETYDVLAVDGRPVISGDVEQAQDGSLLLRTRAGQLYQLHDVPEAVRPGQAVWLQGPASLRVQRYGIIRRESS